MRYPQIINSIIYSTIANEYLAYREVSRFTQPPITTNTLYMESHYRRRRDSYL
jgi:hypothetical protein